MSGPPAQPTKPQDEHMRTGVAFLTVFSDSSRFLEKLLKSGLLELSDKITACSSRNQAELASQDAIVGYPARRDDHSLKGG